MNELFTVISLVLAVIAIIFSVWQTYLAHRQLNDARNQNEEMQRQTEKLETIGNALSTRYLSPFPEYIGEIANVISKAKQNLRIVSSITTPAVYSHPEGWFSIKQEVLKVLGPTNTVNVNCVFSCAATQDLVLKSQFSIAVSDWEGFRSEHGNSLRIGKFFSRYGSGDLNKLNSDGFFNLFSVAAKEELISTYKGATIVHTPYYLPLNMWIADEKEAVFVILSTTPILLAEAFWTTDSDLIGALLRVHSEYCDQILKERKIGTTTV